MSRERPNGRRPLGSAPRAGWALRTPGGATGTSALEAELEAALLDTVAGRSAHEAVGPSLVREARAVLLQHGLGAAAIDVAQQGGTFTVSVRLPTPRPTVLRLNLRLDDQC